MSRWPFQNWMQRMGDRPGMTLVLMGVIFGAMGWEASSRPKPEDTEPFHSKVREVAGLLPHKIGPWVGTDVTASDEAVQLLNPNVIYRRRFENTQTGHVAHVLLVHCKDARDIYGHYPPRCYPSQGKEQLSAKPADWLVADRTISGMEYEFRVEGPNLFVANFIVVPSTGERTPGAIERDMKTVRKRAWEYQNRYYGAAQFQVVFRDPRLGPKQRQAIVEELVEPHLLLIETIRKGG